MDFVSDVEMCLQLAELAATATDSKSKAVCHDDTGTSPVFVENLDDGHERDDVDYIQAASKIMPPLFTNTPPVA